MIPLRAKVRLVSGNGRRIRLWVPFLPLLVLLSPLLVPAAAVACRCHRIPVGRALIAAVRVLAALRGTRIAVDERGTAFSIDFR